MADISHIKGPDNTSYDIKDATANRAIYKGNIDSSSPETMKDFNNLLVSNGNGDRVALYWCALSVMSNGPSDSGYGYLECMLGLQRFTFYNTKITHERTYVNQTWSNWVVANNITIDDSSTANNVAWSASKINTDLSGKVSKSGDTMTGTLTIANNASPSFRSKATAVDASKANNNVSSTQYPAWYASDNSDRILARVEGVVESNGDIGSYWYVRNYNTSGSQVAQKGIKMSMDKGGNMSYTIDENGKFRNALGLATVASSGSYTDLSNKPTIPTKTSQLTNDTIFGYTNEISTNNTTDTWVPVFNGSKIQHRVLSTTYNDKSVVGATSSVHNLPSYSNSVIPSTQYLAYWNGAYDSNSHSNIQYCDRGRLGTIVTSGGTSQVTYTRVNANVSNDAKCWRFGNVVVFTGYFSLAVSNLAKATQLWNGFPKPKCDTYFHARCEGNRTSYDFYITVNGGIFTNQANIPSGTYLVNVTWIC